MAAVCDITGLWDQIKGSPAYLSREQWRAFNLLILCQLIGGTPFMANCSVAGLWDQVRGNPPFITEQQFMAENINLLCQLLVGGGGGGIGTDYLLEYPTIADLPAAPADPTKVWAVGFLDGTPNMRWSPGSTPPQWV